jgi:hypothetical protein
MVMPPEVVRELTRPSAMSGPESGNSRALADDEGKRGKTIQAPSRSRRSYVRAVRGPRGARGRTRQGVTLRGESRIPPNFFRPGPAERERNLRERGLPREGTTRKQLGKSRNQTRRPHVSIPVDQAIDFELPDQEGKDWRLANHLARGPVLLVFYRGDW